MSPRAAWRLEVDEFMELTPGERSLSARSAGVGGPPAADQLAMPSEQRLRAGKERSPGRPGQSPAKGGEEEAVAGTPAGSADLTFEHSKLVAEGENLSAEPGVWPAVDDQDLEQEANDGVGEGEDHDEGGSQRLARQR
jgi:hypothetical protein